MLCSTARFKQFQGSVAVYRFPHTGALADSVPGCELTLNPRAPTAALSVGGFMDHRTFRADDRLNELNDRDDAWGPLLFLRPERHQPLKPARVLVISGLLGAFFGMLANVAIGLMLRPGEGGRPPVLLMPFLMTAIYFVCGNLSLVAAWNRRAHQLSRRMGWEDLTGRPLPPPRDDHAAD
jgi:hypothetical protein